MIQRGFFFFLHILTKDLLFEVRNGECDCGVSDWQPLGAVSCVSETCLFSVGILQQVGNCTRAMGAKREMDFGVVMGTKAL